ncbi:hypothetical protein J4Q44_G00056300 [Coregonus suidteri]|uniref:CUB domain-containing protein n=1 Tax=Coregonus suidteri TaxID=861788 RepID=A0AAN8MCK8_9TELE
MTVSFNLCVINILFVTAYSSLELASSTAHCGRPPQVLEAARGEIRSSVHHSWSYRPRPFNCSWIIKAHVGEPVILSFSQFSTRCKKEWVSVTSSTGKPITLCGSNLPKPMELMGGNITVTHHFLPHLFPVSAFRLGYVRDSGDCTAVDFECLGGRCLPLSWRCNGRVECLGEGVGIDEQDCNGEIKILNLDPEHSKTVVATATPESYRERETEREKNRGSNSRARDWETVGKAPGELEKEEEKTEKEVDADGDHTKEKEPANPIDDFWQFQPRRLPSPQPHRAHPSVNRAPIEWPCGGLLQTFYGTFAPPSIRGPPLFCVWTLDPQDSRPLKLDLRLLELGPGDTVTITNRQQGTGELIKTITSASNYKAIQVESQTGLLSLTYRTLPGSEGLGFNATYRVGGYCPPWEGKCGGAAGGCYTQEQKCDGHWDCPETGHDEAGCRGCPRDQFACGGAGQRAVLAGHNFIGRPVCFPAKERCNYQLYCSDGSDERDCSLCQPGTFHCDSDRCVFESWRCDGQLDCKDGTDELNCTVTLPPKVITCGGLLQTFYGTFAPPSIRGPLCFLCVWTLDPQDSRPLKLDLRLLELGPGDTVTITNRQQGTGELIKTITSASNYKAIQVESQTGLLSLTYRTLPGSEGLGFNATYRVGGYCPPWEGKCGGAAGGCYTQEQKCDGHWDCPETGHDEAGCRGCPRDQFACGGAGQRAVLAGHNFIGRPVCFPAKERCNYQLYCSDGSDERDCSLCQPGTFHCDSDRCVFESWRCDGQLDCKDGTDELNCTVTLAPKDTGPLKLDLRLLELGPGDTVTITNRQQGTGELIKTITNASNYKAIQVESQTGLLSLTYRTLPGSEGLGFNATYRVGGYCPPWEGKCGGAAGGCYTQEQKCDGHWDCPETGHDEAGCRGCPRDQFACGGAGQRAVLAGHNFIGRPVCFPAKERCNYQLYCSDGSDERDCSICQPGTFHCDSDRCVFESWRCDGQVDCKDGTDELNCSVTLPRKVITAATVGSLVCGLLLVIAMGCTCKLYSLRTREYSMFAPISRQEAELIQQQAPPSYGQLIAQGIIPPVEDFPTENPNESSSLTLRGILHLLRQDTANSPRRRHRPRFVRRAVRRMRRWGLIPRPASRPSQPSSSAPQQTDPASTGVEPSQSTPATSSLAVEAVNLPLPQKLGLLPQTVPHQPPPPPSLPPPLVSIPASPQSFPVAAPPTISSPSLASLFHSLGRGISRFRASPSSPTNSLPLSASPSFSSSSEDEVLLIPFSEDMTSEDDVPLLTLDT